MPWTATVTRNPDGTADVTATYVDDGTGFSTSWNARIKPGAVSEFAATAKTELAKRLVAAQTDADFKNSLEAELNK